jgi:hypothetical protein
MPLREANIVAALDISDLYTTSDATAVFADGIRLDQNAILLGVHDLSRVYALCA